MPDDINNLDSNDEGLKAIFGDRFHDETVPIAEATKEKQQTANTTHAVKVEQKPAQKPVEEKSKEAEWHPAKPRTFMDSLMECAKWAMIFGGLNMLIFYWQQAGLMAESIAVPCMWVCCVLAGLGVGTNFVRGERR